MCKWLLLPMQVQDARHCALAGGQAHPEAEGLRVYESLWALAGQILCSALYYGHELNATRMWEYTHWISVRHGVRSVNAVRWVTNLCDNVNF